MSAPLSTLRTADRVAFRRHLPILVASVLCVVLVLAGWGLLRQQDRSGAREFAERAERLRTNTTDAVYFYRYVAARGRPPGHDELRAWHDRNARIDAEAREAALRLRRARPRALALRWIRTQQALRTARVSARVIVASRALFDYCTERQQFVAEAVSGFSLSERMAALSPCFDQEQRGGDADLLEIRAAIGRLEAEEKTDWANLLAAAPEIRP